MDETLISRHHQTFEGIRQVDEQGNEHWLARKLAKVLEYSQYRHFLPVIERAKEACVKSGQSLQDHMEEILDMVDIGTGAKRELSNIRLSRYACYLIVQNGDPSKPVIANGQTYFAIQARRQELQDKTFAGLTEDERRVMLRDELAENNKLLTIAAKEAGVETNLDYAIFQDHRYKELDGTMPENLENPRKGIKEIQSSKKPDYNTIGE